MKNMIFLLFLSFVITTPLMAAEDDVCSEEATKTYKLCNRLCTKFECGSQEDIYTTEKCVNLTDRYIKRSKGEMPPCLPSYGDGFYQNELYCYSNWKVGRLECDPLFDPASDLYLVIDETNGITEYEVCLMNKSAQLDVCMLNLELYAYTDCRNVYSQPCYDEYQLSGDDEALQACLEGVQWEIDACTDEIHDKFYLKYLYPER